MFNGDIAAQKMKFSIDDLFSKLKKRPATILKKRLWHRCFPVNFCEIFKNIFFTKYLWTTTSVFESLQGNKVVISRSI